MALPPCARNLKSRLNGEVTLASGDTKITFGRRVIPRVARARFAAAGAGGKAASAALIRMEPALAAWPLRASARRHQIKSLNLMTNAHLFHRPRTRSSVAPKKRHTKALAAFYFILPLASGKIKTLFSGKPSAHSPSGFTETRKKAILFAFGLRARPPYGEPEWPMRDIFGARDWR